MRDVIRLKAKRLRNPTAEEETPVPPPPAPMAKRKIVPALPAPPPASVSHSRPPAPLGIGQTAGLDKRTAERLDKGRLPIEARLDLHGMMQNAAHGALIFFIQQAWASGKRCVLVITGKGGRSHTSSMSERYEESGVLRRSVPRWLNEAGLRDKVLKFSYAQPRDGGEGALYILLRRRR